MADLGKLECTLLSALVDVRLQQLLSLEDGRIADFRIAGIEVECEYSNEFGLWQIPRRAVGEICLVIWADDDRCVCSLGLVRANEGRLTSRDGKEARWLTSNGVDAISWIIRDDALPENLILQLPPRLRQMIFSHRNGQSRVVELFRSVQGRVVPRTAVETVAQQEDAPKRVRDARKLLRDEGIVILGHEPEHQRVAKALGMPQPCKGEWVSVQLCKLPRATLESVEIHGDSYQLASPPHDVPPPGPLSE